MTLDPFAILRHGIRSVLHNAGASLRISWPWLIIFAVLYAGFAYLVSQSGFGTTPLEPEKGVGTFLAAFLILAAVFAVGFSSIAVNWHRYILLDEMPDIGRRLRFDGHVFSYLGRGLLAGILVALIMILPLFILSLAAPVLFTGAIAPGGAAPQMAMGPGMIVSLIMMAVILTIVTALFFRFALALPAAALGRREVGLFDSWERTKGLFWPLAMVAGGAAVLQLGAQLIVDGVSYVAMKAGMAVGLIVSVPLTLIVLWFFTFLGITLLTTLYGHIVEKRGL